MDNTTHVHNHSHKLKLHVFGFAFASAITWAIWVFVLGMMSMNMNWGNNMVNTLSSIYTGYAPTMMGSLMGAGWAFVCSFIGGLVLAWIYNRIACCCKKDSSCCNKDRV